MTPYVLKMALKLTAMAFPMDAMPGNSLGESCYALCALLNQKSNVKLELICKDDVVTVNILHALGVDEEKNVRSKIKPTYMDIWKNSISSLSC